MPDRWFFFDQIKEAERGFQVVIAAVAYYKPAVRPGEVKMPAETSPRDLEAIADHIEATYLVRMWVSFELALRSYYETKTGDDHIRAVDLINWVVGLKQNLSIPDDVRDLVHEVRNYRNTLVHGGVAAKIAIEESRKRLNSLLHCLPMRW